MDGFIDVVTEVGPGAVVKGVISGTLRMAIPAMLADKVGCGLFLNILDAEPLFYPFLFLYTNYLQLCTSDFIFRKNQPANQRPHNQVMDMVEDMVEGIHNKDIMGDMHNKDITELYLLIMKPII